MKLFKYYQFINESFQEDIIPVKYHNDVKELEKLIKKKDFKKVKEYLKKFKATSKYNYQDSIYFKTEFPSVELEKKLKVKNISKKWNIPFDLNEEEVENIIGIMNDEKITDLLFKEVLRLNPQLEVFQDLSFKDGDYYPRNSVIGGVCSRFNLRDIIDFVDNRRSIDYVDDEKNYIFKSIDSYYSDLYNRLKKKVSDVGYFPSPYTLRNLI